MKKNKVNKKINNSKVLKIIIIACVSIILLELIIMFIMFLNNESKINYIDTINNIKLINNEYYLASGSSNFNNSEYNHKKTYESKNDEGKRNLVILEQAKLTKYDLHQNIIWEKTFDTKYDATYYDSIKVKDGIIAVGSYVGNYSQLAINVRDGLIVKYDDDGNYLWSKNYQVLGDTEFYRVIDVSDGFIAIGQSIYENMEIGNHDMGGGIIVKYDYNGNVIWKNNFGGNKSGSFNDIVLVNDGYIVCGKDGANYGMLCKFSKNGDLIWNFSTLNVGITNIIGFNKMKIYKDRIYIASSVNTSDYKDKDGNPIYQFDAAIYVYDLNGKYIKKIKFGGNLEDVFSDLYIENDKIIAIGETLSNDLFETKKIDKQTGIIIKFNLDGSVISKDYYGGRNSDILTSIIKDSNNNYLISGYSNSFFNKKDFRSIIKIIK